MEIAILIFCCVRNYFRARAANLNAALWSFYTFLAWLTAEIIGAVIVGVIMMINDPQIKTLSESQPANRQKLIEYMMSKNLIVPQIFMLFCAIGGYLFIRYLIIKKADAQKG